MRAVGSPEALFRVETGLDESKPALRRAWRSCNVNGSIHFAKEMCMAVAATVHPALGLSTAHLRTLRFT